MVERYEIVVFEKHTPGSRAAEKSVITGLSWEDVVTRLNKASVDQYKTDAALDEGKPFHYLDHEGKLCRLTRLPETYE